MESVESHYPIRAVSRLTGLSIDTLRAWERRYQAITPDRSQRGRQYTKSNVERLILLRELTERGHTISQVAARPDSDLRDLLSAARPAPGKNPAPNVSIGALVDAFAAFEHTRANDELGRHAALLTPRDLVFHVVLPLIREVGDRWHRGEIGIAQEHLVSASVRNLFGSLVRIYPARPGSRKIVIATLSGEFHEFGILAAAMIASISGLNPLLLGPNLPAGELVEAARLTAADIVLIGCSGSPASPADLVHMAAALPQGTELWVGGVSTSSVPSSAVLLSDMEAFEKACLMRGAMAA